MPLTSDFHQRDFHCPSQLSRAPVYLHRKLKPSQNMSPRAKSSMLLLAVLLVLLSQAHPCLTCPTTATTFCSTHATGYYANPCDSTCTTFFLCSNQQGWQQSCGTGTVFNPTISVCDWPYHYACPAISSSTPSPKQSPTPSPVANPVPSPVPTPVHSPNPSPVSASVVGYYHWTWSTSGSPPNTNMGIAFSGWVDPNSALSDSSAVYNSLPGAKYISLGGGNANGRWSSSALTTLTNAITNNKFSAYSGIVYDIEEGDSGLSSAFATSFSVAKSKGLKVLVTVSHSAPYGISDAADLMRSFFSSSNIDYLSPQLYTGGTETTNDYTTGMGVTWSMWAGCKPKVVPSIVSANLYSSAQSYFASFGITTAGYVQWKQV